MFKVLLLVLLLYLVFRAGRNLLRAAVQDGLMSGRNDTFPRSSGLRGSSGQGSPADRRSTDSRQIEDAVWEDVS